VQTRLYVGNLPFSATEDELRELFGRHGNVQSVSVVTDRETGRARGFAFVQFEDASGAEAAMRALDGYDLGGRPLRVNEAQERGRAPSGGFGGGARPGGGAGGYGGGRPGGGGPGGGGAGGGGAGGGGYGGAGRPSGGDFGRGRPGGGDFGGGRPGGGDFGGGGVPGVEPPSAPRERDRSRNRGRERDRDRDRHHGRDRDSDR
jgi:RNA recognition motif-containing protein